MPMAAGDISPEEHDAGQKADRSYRRVTVRILAIMKEIARLDRRPSPLNRDIRRPK